MDPKLVAELQRKYSGLDDQLNYIAGSTISTRYGDYKAASIAAANAGMTYKNTSTSLKQTKPYSNDVKTKLMVGGGIYTKAGHQTLRPLAETASTKAGVHAQGRENFNSYYQDVLQAKREYDGHVQQAREARNSESKYHRYAEQHQRYS